MATTATLRNSTQWLDPTLPLENRTVLLIENLSLEQKVAFLDTTPPAMPEIGFVGYDFVQDCERGFNQAPQATMFPTGSGLASTFDPSLVYSIGRAAADEAHAWYNDLRAANHSAPRSLSCFGPVTNFAKSPLWGRAQEGLRGEGPDALTRQLVQAYIYGLQGISDPKPDAATGRMPSGAYDSFVRSQEQPDPAKCGPNSQLGVRPEVLTILKHFAAYDGPEGYGYTFGPHAERFSFDAQGVTERDLRQFYLPAFRWGIDAGAIGVMSSYNAIDGVPSSASHKLLTDILRGEWGLDDRHGCVMTDAGAADFIESYHHYVNTTAEAALAAITAGVDMELTCCGAPAVFPTLVEAVRSGALSEAVLDRAVFRVAFSMLRTGALDPAECDPYGSLTVAKVVGSPAHLELAQRAAEESITLFKDGDRQAGDAPDSQARGVLPLAPLAAQPATGEPPQGICVVGPNANQTQAQMGDYHPAGAGRGVLTPWVGIREAAEAAGSTATLVPVPGCEDAYCDSVDREALQQSLEAACAGKPIVVVAGTSAWSHMPNVTNACGCPRGDAIEGECCDRYSVAMPGQQSQVVLAALAAARTARAQSAATQPVALVIVSAMMIDVSAFMRGGDSQVDVVMHAPYLGQMAGPAVAAVLGGKVPASGRAAHTWYDAGPGLHGLPGIKDYSQGMANLTYQFHTAAPLVAFGAGLSAAPFAIDATSLPPSSVRACDAFLQPVNASLLHQAGPGAVAVPQIYVSSSQASPLNPMAVLAGFARLELPSGSSSVHASIAIETEDLAEPWQSPEGEWTSAIVPGKRTLFLANDAGFLSANGTLPAAEFTFVIESPDGKPVPVKECLQE